MNYYNENDPRAAAWLRELIKGGHIPDGHVDERSITEVRPDELSGYTQCHFFAGIGCWSAALRIAGWPEDRPVWTFSCPCQPFSAAGKKKGFEDERHLWPVLFRLLRQLRPVSCFAEQVSSPDGLAWLGAVHADLENEGYAVAPLDLCASGFGAPHIRQRLYIAAQRVGDANDAGSQGWTGVSERAGERAAWSPGLACGMADASSGQCEAGRRGRNQETGARHEDGTYADGCRVDGGMAVSVGERREGERLQPERREADPETSRHGEAGRVADARCPGDECLRGPGEAPATAGPAEREARERERSRASAGPSGSSCRLAESMHAERRKVGQHGEDGHHGENDRRQETHGVSGARGEIRGLADAHLLNGHGAGPGAGFDGGQRIEGELRRVETLPARPGPVNGFWRDADWLLCRDGKWRPVGSGSFPLAHGSPARVVRLRGYGNGLCVPLAAEFIKAFKETLSDNDT